MALQIIPNPVPCGRFGTWQFDVEVRNGGAVPVRVLAVGWQLFRRDGVLADGGQRDPERFFGAAAVPPGERLRARAAIWSHWEAPYTVWTVQVAADGTAAHAAAAPAADYTAAHAAAAPDAAAVQTLTARADLVPVPLAPFHYAPGREAVLAAPAGPGPHPALLILHPHGGSARAMAWAAREAADHGLMGMAVSQPGFGGSKGERDHAGPDSQAAALAAVDYLRGHPAVDPGRIAVWGISLGALLGGLLAARSPDIAAAVLQAGPYDVQWQLERGPDPQRWHAGGPVTAAQVALRNLVVQAAGIRCPVLLVHGEQDDVAPAEHAHRLAARLRGLGRPVELAIYAGHGHGLPPGRVWRQDLLPFLGKHLGLKQP